MEIKLDAIDKSKIGRPPIADTSGFVSAKLPIELHARFTAACDKLQNSAAAVLRHLITEFCNEIEAREPATGKAKRASKKGKTL
jgi:hypothetical protein